MRFATPQHPHRARLPHPSWRQRRRRPIDLDALTPLPRHVGVVMDGNRRWACAAGHLDPAVGHRVGADHVEDLLGWASARGIGHLTVYVLSADNIRRRPPDQVQALFDLLTARVPEVVVRDGRWALHVSGDLDLVPAEARGALRAAERDTADRPGHLTMAIGYDGRADILAAVREAVRSDGADLDEEAITRRLPGGPVKDIDLVIRTSGERRLSGFFPWQSAAAEIHLSERLWPDFGPEDFDAALLDFARRRAGRATPTTRRARPGRS